PGWKLRPLRLQGPKHGVVIDEQERGDHGVNGRDDEQRGRDELHRPGPRSRFAHPARDRHPLHPVPPELAIMRDLSDGYAWLLAQPGARVAPATWLQKVAPATRRSLPAVEHMDVCKKAFPIWGGRFLACTSAGTAPVARLARRRHGPWPQG